MEKRKSNFMKNRKTIYTWDSQKLRFALPESYIIKMLSILWTTILSFEILGNFSNLLHFNCTCEQIQTLNKTFESIKCYYEFFLLPWMLVSVVETSSFWDWKWPREMRNKMFAFFFFEKLCKQLELENKVFLRFSVELHFYFS